jgi:hypothetical protein
VRIEKARLELGVPLPQVSVFSEAFSSQTQDRARLDYYQTKFDRGMILDATKGPIARLANHSCESNCEILKRLVEDQPQIVLFAGDRRSLTEGKLIDDYNFK